MRAICGQGKMCVLGDVYSEHVLLLRAVIAEDSFQASVYHAGEPFSFCGFESSVSHLRLRSAAADRRISALAIYFDTCRS